MPDFVLDELRNHKSLQEKWKKQLGEQFHDQDLVICTETGSIQDPRNLLRVMARIIKKANVKSIRFHDLRHTHTSILIHEGIDIVKISHQLGHANPRITYETYAHLLPNVDNEVADIFHKALQSPR